MEDQRVATSILNSINSTSVNTNVNNSNNNNNNNNTNSLKRPRDAYLYDRDGKKLRGLKGEAAKLMHNHRFFSSEEEIHRLEQTLAIGNRNSNISSMQDINYNNSLNSVKSDKFNLPALPDMFGVISTNNNNNSNNINNNIMNGEGIMNSEGGCNYHSFVSPMQRWSLVQRRHVTLLNNSNNNNDNNNSNNNNNNNNNMMRFSSVGYHWVRADTLHVQKAITSAAFTNILEGEACKREGLPDINLTNNILSTPSDIELTVFHKFVNYYSSSNLLSSPFAFFTITQEEYNTLQLDNDMFQPKLLKDINSERSELWRFDYNSTCKLLEMYERFGNFVVIADRWRYTNINDNNNIINNNNNIPPVEILMERYKLVTETVLCHRLQLLQKVLKDDDETKTNESTIELNHNNNNINNNNSVSDFITNVKKKNKKTTEERITSSSNKTHPLISLIEKHPILEARRKRREWLLQKQKELFKDSLNDDVNIDRKNKNNSNNEEVEENVDELQESRILDLYRNDIIQKYFSCLTSSSSSSVMINGNSNTNNNNNNNTGNNNINGLTSIKSNPSLPPISPFWYDGILEQARRSIIHAEVISESKVNVPYFRAVLALQRVDSQATLLFDKLRAITHDSNNNNNRETSDAISPTDIENNNNNNNNISSGAGGRKKSNVGRRSRKNQNNNQNQISDVLGEDSYQAIQEEVHLVPLHCERLKLCVQAGWFLPPPTRSTISNTNNNNNSNNNNNNNNNNNHMNNNVNNSKPSAGSAVTNRALSNFSEALLLTLPPSVPKIHLGVELELEKHLWEDHRALCDDNAEVQELLSKARVLYTQNIILRRFAGKCGVLEGSLRKLASEAAVEEDL